MEILNMEVMIVDREDYANHLRSIYGIKASQWDISEADLIVDRETGKILKSRHFRVK